MGSEYLHRSLTSDGLAGLSHIVQGLHVQSRIISICQQLGILSFTEKLPTDFATVLGERGARLSGGQKQRLASARALYRQPEILILDEAALALDTVSEQYMQRTLRPLLAAGKTVILIAHRLSTVMHADTIVVLAADKPVEQGTHEQLLEEGGTYYQLWQQLLPTTSVLAGAPKPCLFEAYAEAGYR
jgi:ABC-type multidrug transport system fused ATPase/permease subunit